MPIISASLADGQLSDTKATILSAVAANTAAHVSHIVFVNTDASSHTINLYVKRSGSSSRRLIDKDKSIAAGASYSVAIGGPSGWKLSAGDVLEGDADTASVVDYFIDGGVEGIS